MAEEQVPEWFETAQRREQMKAEVRDLHALIFCTLRSIDRTEREAGRPLPSGSEFRRSVAGCVTATPSQNRCKTTLLSKNKSSGKKGGVGRADAVTCNITAHPCGRSKA